MQGLATAVAITGLGAWPKPVWALKSPGDPVVLSGTQFDLVIGQTPMTITGRTRERR